MESKMENENELKRCSLYEHREKHCLLVGECRIKKYYDLELENGKSNQDLSVGKLPREI